MALSGTSPLPQVMVSGLRCKGCLDAVRESGRGLSAPPSFPLVMGSGLRATDSELSCR